MDDQEALDQFMSATPYASLPDQIESAQMQAVQPGAGGAAPWWQALVTYGAARAIDNRFGPVNVTGNVQAGSYQAAGGRTALNDRSATMQPGLLGLGGGGGGLLLLALAAGAFMLLKD